jgi:hypothetical protein
MEGRSTAGDGHWPVLRTEVWRRFVPIRCCGMGWPQEPEWTGHACCSKSFKLGSMFKLGAFKAGSNRFEHRGREDLRYVARPRFPLDAAKRTMARAGCDRMRHPPGYRHGRRRHCGFSGCSGSWGLRSPQNRSDCWPPPNRNPRWRRTPCSEPVTSFRALPTLPTEWTATAPTHQTRNLAEHVSNCICLHCLHQNPSAPLIDREACRGSRKARKRMETNFSSARFQHQESHPPRFNSKPCEDCPHIKTNGDTEPLTKLSPGLLTRCSSAAQPLMICYPSVTKKSPPTRTSRATQPVQSPPATRPHPKIPIMKSRDAISLTLFRALGRTQCRAPARSNSVQSPFKLVGASARNL